jgi:hypothetical protein
MLNKLLSLKNLIDAFLIDIIICWVKNDIFGVGKRFLNILVGYPTLYAMNLLLYLSRVYTIQNPDSDQEVVVTPKFIHQVGINGSFIYKVFYAKKTSFERPSSA